MYCAAAADFKLDLTQPPAITIAPPPRSRASLLAHVAMSISKPATVNFAVSYGGRTVSATTISVSHGTHSLTWRPPHAGRWTISLKAVDLLGNRAQTSTAVTILAPPPRRHHHQPSG